jgi:hypothetical protein
MVKLRHKRRYEGFYFWRWLRCLFNFHNWEEEPGDYSSSYHPTYCIYCGHYASSREAMRWYKLHPECFDKEEKS